MGRRCRLGLDGAGPCGAMGRRRESKSHGGRWVGAEKGGGRPVREGEEKKGQRLARLTGRSKLGHAGRKGERVFFFFKSFSFISKPFLISFAKEI